MKLSIILLLATCLQVSAAGNAQTISISVKDAALESVIKNIRKQSGYDFVYTREAISKAKPISLNIKNANLKEALDKCFLNQPLTYSIIENVVVVKGMVLPVATPVKQEIIIADIDVRGKVVDENGTPVLASVTVKGTSNATSTNEKGEFELKSVPENATLVFTGVGIERQEVKVSGRMNITVTVKTRITTGEEVVISTGYQNLKKTQLTGSYSTIGRETYLQNVPVSGNIVENMEGKIPGLILNINPSRDNWQDPNNTSPFTIRGVSTFQAIKKPLIVLNGYPTEIDIESINPYDIESITVLKDAAAAAIYGVRASNGVVVITTRSGRKGKPVFNFTTALTHKPKPNYNKLDLLSGRKFIDFEVAVSRNDIENNFMSKDFLDMMNGTYTPVFGITDNLINGVISQQQADMMFDSLGAYDNTEDYKRLFLQTPLLQTYDLNVSGGGENSTYILGVNRVDNQGSDKHADFTKTNINYKGSFEFFDRLNLNVQSIYSNIQSKSVPIPIYTTLEPYQHFLNKQGQPSPTYFSPESFDYFGYGGSYGTLSAARNEANMAMGLYDEMYYPVQEMKENSTKTRSDVYRFQANLKARITSGLNLEVGGAYEREIDNTVNIGSENAYATRIMLNYYASPDPFSGKPVFGIPQGGVKKTTDHSINSYTLRAQLTYNKLLAGKHDLSLLGGVEQRKITNSGNVNTVFGYNSNTLTIKPTDLTLLGSFLYYPGYSDVIVPLSGFGVYDQTFANAPPFSETITDNRFLSYYANAAYTFDHRYTLTGSMRLDQSNLFGTDPKFRYTPLWSLGAAWHVSHENFLQNSSIVNNLNVRLASGYNGNIIKNSGPYNILSSSVNTYLQNPTVGYSIRTPRNNSLRWEKTLNLNGGIDFTILNNRVSGSVDYYIKRGKDIFNPIQIDPTFGFSNILTNNASIENRGLDIMLSTENIRSSHFSWKTQVTGSFNKSKVLKVRNKWNGFYMFTRAGGAENLEGHPMNSVLTLEYAGLNDDGQPLIKDEKGKLIQVGFGKPDITFDALHFAGVNDPRYSIGFINQFSSGSFNLSVLLMYYGGHVALIAPPSIYDLRPTKGMANFWQKTGDEETTDIPGFNVANRYGYQYGQRFVRKMDFIAIRDITLTYNMKEHISKRIGLNNTKLILQVQNPGKYVFSGNDIDPETLDFSSGRRGLPILPAFTFSLSTSF